MSVDAIGVDASGGNDLAGQSTDSQQEPQIYDLPDENALVRVKGSDKPVKYSEIGRNFQAQWTKEAQRRAQLERELQTEREQRQRFEQERQRAGQNQNQPDPLASLRERPYLTGEEAATVVQGIVEQVKERDKYIGALYKKLQEVEKRFGGMYESHTNSAFDSKINKWVSELGYDPQAEGVSDIAKEIYLAYEGNDLDQEFPQIFANRMKQIESFFEARKKSQLEKARRQPFIPGRGGQAGPSSPIQLKPNASPREIADMLWNGGDGSGT
jgi:hypothetical protein